MAAAKKSLKAIGEQKIETMPKSEANRKRSATKLPAMKRKAKMAEA